jgi:hypothetical protein
MGILVWTIFDIAAFAGMVFVARFIMGWLEAGGERLPPPGDEN